MLRIRKQRAKAGGYGAASRGTRPGSPAVGGGTTAPGGASRAYEADSLRGVLDNGRWPGQEVTAASVNRQLLV